VSGQTLSEKLPLDVELINVLISWIDKAKQRQEFIKGIAFGVFYGIIGNVAVSHYYGLFESFTTGKYDALFSANLTSLLVALAVILLVSRKWLKTLAKLDAEQQSIRKEIGEVLRKRLEETKETSIPKKKENAEKL